MKNDFRHYTFNSIFSLDDYSDKILLIDNYDSFTYNLYHYISNFKKNVEVVRNDKIDGKTILRKK